MPSYPSAMGSADPCICCWRSCSPPTTSCTASPARRSRRPRSHSTPSARSASTMPFDPPRWTQPQLKGHKTLHGPTSRQHHSGSTRSQSSPVLRGSEELAPGGDSRHEAHRALLNVRPPVTETRGTPVARTYTRLFAIQAFAYTFDHALSAFAVVICSRLHFGFEQYCCWIRCLCSGGPGG